MVSHTVGDWLSGSDPVSRSDAQPQRCAAKRTIKRVGSRRIRFPANRKRVLNDSSGGKTNGRPYEYTPYIDLRGPHYGAFSFLLGVGMR